MGKEKIGVCPKCGNKEMIGGYTSVPFAWGIFDSYLRWSNKPILGGLFSANSKIVTTYKCSKCGYLENYAE